MTTCLFSFSSEEPNLDTLYRIYNHRNPKSALYESGLAYLGGDACKTKMLLHLNGLVIKRKRNPKPFTPSYSDFFYRPSLLKFSIRFHYD